ncbi:MAG TPA: SUF system NifU family Fe-S cluster assembly protein [Dokdonella sp.]
MSAAALYPQVVLDHYRNPRNRGRVDGCTHAADGVNALCGDTLHVELDCTGDRRIAAIRFSGEACAITTATASMLSELVGGMDEAEVALVAQRFEQLIGGAGEDRALGDLNAMAELQRHPARRKCAQLPWATLRAALAGQSHTTTEQDSA